MLRGCPLARKCYTAPVIEKGLTYTGSDRERAYKAFIQQPLQFDGRECDLEEIFQTEGGYSLFTMRHHTEEETVVEKVIVDVSPTHITIEPEWNTEIGLEATIENATGLLTIHVNNHDVEGERYEGFPYGGQLYYAAIVFFRQYGSFSAIHEVWREGEDNYIDYQIKRENGLSPTQAANATWSGIVLNLLQFTNVGEVDESQKGTIQANFLSL